jgi:hypothetical protein
VENAITQDSEAASHLLPNLSLQASLVYTRSTVRTPQPLTMHKRGWPGFQNKNMGLLNDIQSTEVKEIRQVRVQPTSFGYKSVTTMQLRFVAFPATEYDEVFSGYQPGQMVDR